MICFNALQSENADEPIAVTPLGIVTSDNDQQFVNIFDDINSKFSDKTTDIK